MVLEEEEEEARGGGEDSGVGVVFGIFDVVVVVVLPVPVLGLLEGAAVSHAREGQEGGVPREERPADLVMASDWLSAKGLLYIAQSRMDP